MHFLAPSYLHLLWIALIPVALWLFRRKAKRVHVSTLLFFRTLAREHNESAWLRRLKKWLSLLLTLLVIIMAVLALARPSREAGDAAPGAVVFMIDCSASMAATDGKESRLEEARRLARDRVARLTDNAVVSLIAFDDKPQVLLSRSRNRREFVRLLDTLAVTPSEGAPEAALAVARRLAALEQPSQLWHLGDHRIEGTVPPGYRFSDVSLKSVANVGITGFQIRPAPLSRDRYEGFVRVSASAANKEPMAATLEARIGGRIAQLRELELKPGASTSLILPLEGLHGELLELELKSLGDCLGWDNAVISPLPKSRPLVVAWLSDAPDPFTELALGALIEAGRIEILKGTPAQWPLKDKPDVYVFENWVPDSWPQDRPVLALSPPRSSGPLKVRALASPVPYDAVRSVSADHPVLYRVNSSRLSLTQTTVLDAGSALESLWMAGSEPVLAAGEFNSQRVVVTAFSPSRSEQLALLPAYPLLLGNALYWCAENSEVLADLRPRRTGEVIAAEGEIQWHAWDGKAVVTALDPASGSFHEFNRVGAWEAGGGRSGTCILASAAETDLTKLDPAAPGEKDSAGQSPAGGWTRGMNAWQTLIWAVLLLLLLESFLFHHKAVY